jgi:hypothetical protein
MCKCRLDIGGYHSNPVSFAKMAELGAHLLKCRLRHSNMLTDTTFYLVLFLSFVITFYNFSPQGVIDCPGT